MTDYSLLVLHTELFVGGKNFGTKIRPNLHQGLELVWDDGKQCFLVTYNNEVATVRNGNIAYDVKKLSKAKPDPVNEHKTESVHGRRKAQVSTPHGYVFEGEGKGKTKV
jgi:hypothetical protein